MERPQTFGWGPTGCTPGVRANQKRTGKTSFETAQPPAVRLCPPWTDGQQHEDRSVVAESIARSLTAATVFTCGAEKQNKPTEQAR